MDDGDVEIDGDSEGRDVGHCDADGTIDGAEDGSVDNDGCVEIEGDSDGRLVLMKETKLNKRDVNVRSRVKYITVPTITIHVSSLSLTATVTPKDSSKASCSAQLRSTGCH